VVGLSHRILVMNQGMIKADLQGHETDLPSVLGLCLGEEKECDEAE
jgi:ABC-type sugar transport system ATPase subunit